VFDDLGAVATLVSTRSGAKVGKETELNIAMLAPPWIPIPAPAYGGIEEVIHLLCDGLVDRGHDVTLFAAPGSRSKAEVRWLLDAAHPDEIERTRWEVDHVARAFADVDREAFDLVHDHTGHTALAMADRLATPLVHTLHGPFDDDSRSFYATHGDKATIVAISAAQLDDAPPQLRDSAVVYNPLRFEDWPLSEEPGDHVLWVGRMAPVKGPHRAIRAAREAGVPIVLAGPVQPGQEEFFATEVEPLLDQDGVTYVGEVGAGDKADLYGGARALLMPIRWAEPFGMVMTEAMACGTPVIAFAEGSAPELIEDGVNGFVVDDEDAMARTIGWLDEIDRARCREHGHRRFGVDACIDGYEEVYGRAAVCAPKGARFRRRAAAAVPAGLPPRAPR
jgi:glycosyltransferase involved in cell wall biosynthesis